MSRNVTHKTNATAKEEDVVFDILEQGMTTQQQHPTSPSQQRRLEAGDDDTEAPPIPKRHDIQVPDLTDQAMPANYDEVIMAETGVASMPQRKMSAPQLAPAMERETPQPPQRTVAPSANAAPSSLSPPGIRQPDATTTMSMVNDWESGEMVTPTPSPPPPLQRLSLLPGAFPITGPGVRRFGRRYPASEDQRTVMTPVAAEVVHETPLVVAVPATPNWWSKRRNQLVVAGVSTLVIALTVIVTVLIMSGNNNSSMDATPPPSPQTPTTMTPVPTTASPTMTAPPITTPSPTTPTTPSPTTPVPATPTPTMTLTTMPTPAPTPMHVSTPVPTTTIAPITDAWQWKQMGQDIDGEAASDWSGYAVSLSADGATVAISAWGNDGNGDEAGHVRVHQWNGGGWVQLGNDIDGEAADDRSGWSVSLSADGTTVAIGADWNDGNGDWSGHVRVHQWNGGGWVQLGNDIDGEATSDGSGWSVSLSADGTTVAIGAIGNDGNGGSAGHVRVHQWNGGGWVQLGNDIDGEAADDRSGWSVPLSADGNTVAIGAPNNNGNGDDAGHVSVYQWNGGGWVQVGNDIDGEAADDWSGHSVSLSADGTTVAIGAPGAWYSNTKVGYVQVYRLTGNDWIKVGSDLEGEAVGDNFGYSVSLSADGMTLAVGAPYNDGNGDSAGHVCLYRLTGNEWIQIGSDLDGEAAGDNFGRSVSLSPDGSTVAVGARYNDGTGTEAGHVRVFHLEEE